MAGETLTDPTALGNVARSRNGELPPGGSDGEGDRFGSARIPERTYLTGMVVALGGILMFFAALVSALVVRKGLSPVAWQSVEVPGILWLNTLVLLGSSGTLVRSRRCFLAEDDVGFRHWWGVTMILGVFFVIGQSIAWRQLIAGGVYLATSASSSFFYLLTAAHGLHLVGGIVALTLVAFRRGQHVAPKTATAVVSIYWHFVGVLWFCLFVLLLLQDRL